MAQTFSLPVSQKSGDTSHGGSPEVGYPAVMKFHLIRELDDGQRMFVSAHDSRIEAERKAQALREFWPGVYVIRQAPFLLDVSPTRSQRHVHHPRY